LEIFHGRVSDGTHSLILREAGAAPVGCRRSIPWGFPGYWCRWHSYSVDANERWEPRSLSEYSA
jgi:hypothetical protein